MPVAFHSNTCYLTSNTISIGGFGMSHVYSYDTKNDTYDVKILGKPRVHKYIKVGNSLSLCQENVIGLNYILMEPILDGNLY